MPRARLSKEQRARRYLQASMEAGYTGLPAEHKRAKESLMAAHERAYPKVREHALAGANRDFDLPLTSGERGHQRHLREQEGLTEADVRGIRDQLRATPARHETRPSSSGRALAAPASSSAGAASNALGAAATGKGSLFLQLAGILLGLSLIYLLVAGKGVKALTGLTSVVTGAVRAFVAPVDPIAKLESALGATPVSAGSTSSSSSGSTSGGTGSVAAAAEAATGEPAAGPRAAALAAVGSAQGYQAVGAASKIAGDVTKALGGKSPDKWPPASLLRADLALRAHNSKLYARKQITLAKAHGLEERLIPRATYPGFYTGNG